MQTAYQPQVLPLSQQAAAPQSLEFSVVIPCLNEAETLAVCIQKARHALDAAGVRGEVVVADNGSTDGSQQIATSAGARVVPVPERGYGAALIGGIEAAVGEYVIMGDADDSYDFSGIAPFIDKLRDGYDLVMGTRLKGTIMPGAMPGLHRWLGNPVLTFIGNVLFRAGVSDFHCGLRGFKRSAILALDLRTSGMEFATEMVAKAALGKLRIAEIPIVYHPDGRSRPPHLRTWRDGWRHLKFMLLLSPLWVFMWPGILMLIVGTIGLFAALMDNISPNSDLFGRGLIIQLLASIAILIGAQIVFFGVLARLFAAKVGLLQRSPVWERLADYLSLDQGLAAGGIVVVGGLALILNALGVSNLQALIVGLLVLVLGTQVVFVSFVVSLIRIKDNFR
ncbi:MAG: glycosyltransferase family 2 protein [Chloroflexi bacterium]|nr:glycosyltransferase family 2 protein [Chloroflexota bacterium]